MAERNDLRQAAVRIRSEYLHRKSTTWDSAESECLRDRLAELDAYLAGLDGLMPSHLADRLGSELKQMEREGDPEWPEHLRLVGKFGDGR